MVKDTTAKLIAIYREKLASLSAEHDVGSIDINPLELVGSDFSGLENPEILYEKYKETYKEKTGSHKEKNPEREGWGFFKFWEPWEVDVIDYEDREAVDATEFAQSYFAKFRVHIENLCQEEIIKYAEDVTESIKLRFKEKFSELDGILAKKLEELKAYTGSAENLTELLAKTESNLKWLEGIQKRIAEILEI
jgi:hypothetical protein